MYPCEMKNISTTGALVCMSMIIPANIQLGDTCDLMFGSLHTLSPLNFRSKVIRLDDYKIALHLLDPAY
jgi:hypothetical protein